MKTKYTRKQIQESIKHWQRVLESMNHTIQFSLNDYDNRVKNFPVVKITCSNDQFTKIIRSYCKYAEDLTTYDLDTSEKRTLNDLVTKCLNACSDQQLKPVGGYDGAFQHARLDDSDGDISIRLVIKSIDGERMPNDAVQSDDFDPYFTFKERYPDIITW